MFVHPSVVDPRVGLDSVLDVFGLFDEGFIPTTIIIYAMLVHVLALAQFATFLPENYLGLASFSDFGP